jgi:hypothetical protein
VTISTGKGVGAMTGYGWVALGSKDSLSDPKCGTAEIKDGTTCASTTWSTKDSLCMSGSIPMIDSASPDYTGNWGVLVGLNATDPAGGVLGQSFSSITIAVSGTPSSGLRAKIHKKGDSSSVDYCATYTTGAMTLTSFTTTCYDTAKPGTALTAADVPNIDQVGVQVSSSDKAAITVTNLCITGITFAK